MERVRFALQLPSEYHHLVRRAVALGLVVIGAASCATAPRVRWEKAGVSPGEQQRDETDCTSRASLESSVPSAQRVSPTGSTPVDPQVTRVRPLDSTVYEDCMRTRGYERIAPAN
jgi:hypothetical protein